MIKNDETMTSSSNDFQKKKSLTLLNETLHIFLGIPYLM